MGEFIQNHDIHFTFCKAERLCRSTLIEALFRSKSAVRQFPLLLSWLPAPLDSPYPAQVLISVSKKKFRKATDRNRIKRQCREVYRLNKHLLYAVLQHHNITCAVGLTYMASKQLPASELSKAFQNLITQLEHELGKTTR